MRYYYINDEWGDNEPTVVCIGTQKAYVITDGVKPYKMRHAANKYLQEVASGKVELDTDEIVDRDEDESYDDFTERVVGEMSGHIGYFETILPESDPRPTTYTTFYKSICIFPKTDIWYKTEKEAKKDADGMDTIYLGPVEVYDPAEIKRIEEEIASYPED